MERWKRALIRPLLLKEAEIKASGEAVIVTHDLSKHFGGVKAVDGVDVEIGPNEIVGLIGPNGSGKSTLLALLSGIYRPTSGSITLMGSEQPAPTARAWALRGIGRTFQKVRLWSSLTVEETIRLGSYLPTKGERPDILANGRWGSLRRGVLNKYEISIAESLGLLDVMNREADTLSHADQRRVELARALAGRPRILLLDEPAAGLGHDDRLELREFLATLPGEGITLLIVEHALDVVLPISTRVIVMNEGEVIFEGSADECVRAPVVRDAYLGEG